MKERFEQLPSDRDASGRSLGDEELSLLREVIESGALNPNGGTMLRRFEEGFAERVGRRHAVACTSGSFAVQAAVAALELKPGDEVVTTPITDFGALSAVLYEGLIPRFCDVDPETLMPTADTIRAAITGEVRAVIATHLFGRAARMEEIRELCDELDLSLVEDAAQALGSHDRGQHAGTLSKIATWSFQQGKHITCGEGGIVLCDDDALARRLRLYVNKAWPYGEPNPDHLFVAPNGRITELQGAVLLAQLGKLDRMLERRQGSAEALLREAVEANGVSFPELAPGDRHSYWRIALLVDPYVIPGGVDALAERIRERGIPSGPHYVGRPAFELLAFREQRSFGGSSWPWKGSSRKTPYEPPRREDYPGAIRGLERVLVLPWNEGFDVELATRMGRAIREEAEELAR